MTNDGGLVCVFDIGILSRYFSTHDRGEYGLSIPVHAWSPKKKSPKACDAGCRISKDLLPTFASVGGPENDDLFSVTLKVVYAGVIQGGPLPVISGVISPINGLING